MSEENQRRARELAAHVLQGSGYWMEASPEHISAGVAGYLAQALDEAEERGRASIGARPVVLWFAAEMEAKLRENDHKGGWSECTVGYLVERLREETVELEMALDAKPFDVVIREAADVANFAMMLADLCAPKPPTPTTEEG